jgi:DsbC/DsbD-like thiol-disulfide interchange protein
MTAAMRPDPLAALLLCLLAAPALGEAPSLPSAGGEALATLEALPGWRTGEGRHMAALRITLAPGWKTYWRSPGAAGLAPLLDLGASEGIAGAEARWPVPEVFEFGGMRSIGYHDAVTIPLDLALAGGAARLEGAIEIGVCAEVCVPVRLPFAVDLPEAGDRDPLIAAALVDRPMTAEEAGMRATCAVAPGAEGLGLTVRVEGAAVGPDEVVVVETSDPGLWVSEARAAREGGVLVASAEALARGGGPVALDRSSLRITVIGDGRAVDIRDCGAG